MATTPTVEEHQPPDEAPWPRRRWIWIGSVLAVVAVVVTVGLLSQDSETPGSSSDDIRIGDGRIGEGPDAPEFSLPRLDGDGEISLDSLEGKPVVVNLFASWCAPCLREMPGFQTVHEKVGGQVAFVGINHQDTRDGGLDVMRDTGVTYPAAFDPDGTVAADYRLLAMPSTIFISADGRILERHHGEISGKELEEKINQLF